MISMCLSLMVTPWTAVHALDFLDQVALNRVATARLEVLLRVDRPVGDRVAGTHQLAVLDEQLGVVRDRVLALDDVLAANPEALGRLDHQAALGRPDLVDRAVLRLVASDDLVGLDQVTFGDQQLVALARSEAECRTLRAR